MTQEEAFEKLNISVDLIPAGSGNRPGTLIQPAYVTLHNTANSDPGADALMHAKYVKGPDARARKVSWHFTVDDRRVVKHLPTNEKGWHAGSGNARSIAIEVCENAGIDTEAAVDRAALLTAVLMLAHGIPAERVVTHKSWTGKDCPRVLLRRPGGFAAFRKRAAAYRAALEPPAGFESFAAERGAAGPIFAAAARSAELRSIADVDDAAGFLASPEDAVDGRAELEQLVGRLMVENQRLREALAEFGAAFEDEPEAD